MSPPAGCSAPPRLVFAELKEAFRNQSIFPVGRAVEYVCRPGYSAHPGMSATIVCLENQTWSAALEFCKGASCSARLGWKITLLGCEALWLYGFRCLGQPAVCVSIPGGFVRTTPVSSRALRVVVFPSRDAV